MATKQEIDNVKATNDIVSTISNDISLFPKGNSLVGLCPFHEDSNPSLNVNSAKQRYKCFACNAQGDVIDYIKNTKKFDFQQAVEYLANQSNLQITKKISQEEKQTPKYNEKAEKIIELNERFSKLARINLLDKTKPEFQNLLSRGIDLEYITKHELGLVNSDSDIIAELKQNFGYTEDDLKEASFINDNNRQIIHNRIYIPIEDENGFKVGYTARTTSNDDIKYLNSRENEIFKKHEILYNYSNAVKQTKEQSELYIVEGVFDVISMEQAGHSNTVSLLGSVLTDKHIELIKKLKSPNIVLTLDPDEAGIKATQKTIKLLMDNNIKNEVVINNTNKDINELKSTDGKEALNKILEQRISGIDFAYKYISSKYDLKDATTHKEYVSEIDKYFDKSDQYIKTNIYSKMKSDHKIDHDEFYKYEDFKTFWNQNKHKSQYELAKELYITRKKLLTQQSQTETMLSQKNRFSTENQHNSTNIVEKTQKQCLKI